MSKKEPKTRKINDAALSARLREGCPHCGARLVARARRTIDDDTGKEKLAGAFFGCSNYGKTCFADYSIGLDGRERNWE